LDERIMTQRALLYISLGRTGACAAWPHFLEGWEIRQVDSLADAARELRTREYTAGLFDYTRARHQLAEIDAFLRRHPTVQWTGIFDAADLECSACRELVVEHLFDYHTVPVDPLRLAHALGHAHGLALLGRRHEPAGAAHAASPLVGSCESMKRLRSHIGRVARVAAPVLLWGESGSGKELAAQAIHEQSSRAGGPFVPVNCGAMSPTLIHSELFGYERGAFTGATQAKAGLIEAADGGTLFLDEIGDLPKELQANLLRFLQENTICRLGSTRDIKVDVRVLAASHLQLQDAVARGDFREDLYYRLAVLPVTVPPLRERREDIVALAEHFFHIHASEKAARLKGFSDRAIAAMLDHAWPGNVRELINRVRRAMVMSDGRLVEPEDLGLAPGVVVSAPAVLDDARTRSERSALRACLDRSGHNVSRAARDLGVSRTTMYRLLAKHGMRDGMESRWPVNPALDLQ
jgi:DNA-binding NtrC family response regulator